MGRGYSFKWWGSCCSPSCPLCPCGMVIKPLESWCTFHSIHGAVARWLAPGIKSVVLISGEIDVSLFLGQLIWRRVNSELRADASCECECGCCVWSTNNGQLKITMQLCKRTFWLSEWPSEIAPSCIVLIGQLPEREGSSWEEPADKAGHIR